MANTSFFGLTGTTASVQNTITASVTAAALSETNAATSATNAATSETNAANSATAAANSATQAANSATAAAASATTASGHATTATTQATNASNSATAAGTSATNAATSATNAATSETNAGNSATAAATSATNAATSATNAATSETNAASSATAAAGSATTASTQATNAANSATAAAGSATTASGHATTATTQASTATTQATNAANSASTASTQATNAANSATAAATSATNAATSATAANTAKTGAETALDDFTDIYLGAKNTSSGNPTTDNDGDALQTGALMYDSTNSLMKTYNGSAWVAAFASAGGALINSNNLSDVSSASSARGNLGLGTAAVLNTGTSAGNAIVLDGSARLPAVDGSQLTGLPSGYSGWTVSDGSNSENIASTDTVTFAGAGAASVAYNTSNNTLTVTGTDTTYSAATTSAAGLMSAADKTKLDGVEASATADQTAAEIRALVESATDSNVFTDADHTKLDAIEASADVTDTTNVVAALTAGTGITIAGNGTIATTVTATTSASDLTSGTLPDARFPSVLPAISGANLTNLPAAGIASVAADTSPELGGDLETDGNHIIVSGTGQTFSIKGSGETLADFTDDGGVVLYHNGTAKAQSQFTGWKSFSNLEAANNIVLGSQYALQFGNGVDRISANNSTNIMQFYANNTERMQVNTGGVDVTGDFVASGNVTAYSDQRLKDNIQTIDNALNKVEAMRGVTFTKDGELSSGVIAQEMEQIAPELVMDGEFKSVAYGNLVGYLIEAVKELSDKVKELEAK